MRLLFTGGGGAGSAALASLLEPDHEVHFCDNNPDARPIGIHPENWHVIPAATQRGFVEALRELTIALQTTLLIPGVDEELLPLAMSRRQFDCAMLLPEAEVVATHPDKLHIIRTLRDWGIAAPRTERLKFRKEVQFPCVIKPRFGRGSRDVAVVRNEAELAAHLIHCDRPAVDFIAQEYLSGDEYTVGILANQDRTLQAIVPVRVQQKKGVTLRGVTEFDPAVLELAEHIFEAQPCSGYLNVQCIKGADGIARPFEINPRVSTTTCLAIAAGMDLVGGYLCEGRPAPTLTAGLQLRRSWATEFV